MSTDRATFEESLVEVDVESVHVPPAGVADAIDEFVDGPAVGIPDDAWGESLPSSVDWDPTPAALRAATTGVTAAEFGIAEYGSLVLPSDPPANELVSLYVDRHVAVVNESDVVADMETAFERFDADLADEYNDAIIATGPSATADMGALVKGAHGPKEVRAIVVED